MRNTTHKCTAVAYRYVDTKRAHIFCGSKLYQVQNICKRTTTDVPSRSRVVSALYNAVAVVRYLKTTRINDSKHDCNC